MDSKIAPQVYTRQQEKERRRFKRGVKRLLDALGWPITRVERMFQFVSSDDWGADYSFLSAMTVILWLAWLGGIVGGIYSAVFETTIEPGFPAWSAFVSMSFFTYLVGIMFAHEASQFESHYE